ncbi:MAG: hypothetical protein KA143_10250 [Saprospiraceae bacterium]|nr:hypothetical protein [Saprospiraceae bacterium]
MANAASSRTIAVPAQFTTVSKKNLVRKGGFTGWREGVFESDVTGAMIQQVQAALKAKGYDSGAVANKLNIAIKSALTKFQKDKNLPIRSLGYETLKAWGNTK